MSRITLAIWVAVLACAGVAAQGNSASLGIFEVQNDVGNVLHPGLTEYDPDTKTYVVSGSGENMWFAADEFHFVYVGIGVCAHNKDAVQKVAFANVSLEETVTHAKADYSTVETVLLSTDARVGYVSRKHLTSRLESRWPRPHF
jgi:hypothetical protein